MSKASLQPSLARAHVIGSTPAVGAIVGRVTFFCLPSRRAWSLRVRNMCCSMHPNVNKAPQSSSETVMDKKSYQDPGTP